MSDQVALVDLYGMLGFVCNADGSVTRKGDPPSFPSSYTSISSYSNSPILLVKDITVNQSKSTWVRVFIPREKLESSPGTKLPVIVYFHSGGFILDSAGSTPSCDICSTFAIGIPAIVLSVEYRLAPEHRLPAAYDDSMEVLHWIKSSQDEWLMKYADFSNSFVMGSSAGGNIAYRIGLDASSCADDLKPLNIKGLILHQPFFGSTKRTEAEMSAANNNTSQPSMSDIIWELALPIGVDRDHEFCNPIKSFKSGQFNQIKGLGWKILVTGYGGDPLIARQMELVKLLEENGVEVVARFTEGGSHGIEMHDPSKRQSLCGVIKEFVASHVVY